MECIVGSRSAPELALATDDAVFDYAPPTDARPFFFNMVRPSAWWRATTTSDGGVIAGNLRRVQDSLDHIIPALEDIDLESPS